MNNNDEDFLSTLTLEEMADLDAYEKSPEYLSAVALNDRVRAGTATPEETAIYKKKTAWLRRTYILHKKGIIEY